jgi:hypothetical protein
MATVHIEAVPTYIRTVWTAASYPYSVGDRVSYNGGTDKIYVCISGHTSTATTPNNDPTNWVLAGSKEYPFQLIDGIGNAGVAGGAAHGEFNLQYNATIKTNGNYCRDAAGVGGTIVLGDGVYDINGAYHATTNALDLGDGINLTALNNRKARVTFQAQTAPLAGPTSTGTMTGIRFGFRVAAASQIFQGALSLKFIGCTIEDSTPYGNTTYSTSGPRIFYSPLSLSMVGTEVIILHTRLGMFCGAVSAPSAFISCTIYFSESGQFGVFFGGPTASVEFKNCIIYCKTLNTNNWSFIPNDADVSIEGLAWFVETANGNTPMVGGSLVQVFENVLNIDPVFVDEPNSNLELRPSSPLIGAGTPPPGAAGVAGDHYFAPIQVNTGTGADADNAELFSPTALATAEGNANSLSTIYFLPGTYPLSATLTFNATTAPGLTYQSTEPNKAILEMPAVALTKIIGFNQTATFKDFSTKDCGFAINTDATTATLVGLKHENTVASDYGWPGGGFLQAYGGAVDGKTYIIKESTFVLYFSGASNLFGVSSHTLSVENCAFHCKAASVSAGNIQNAGAQTFWTFKNTIFTSDNSSAFKSSFSIVALSTSCCFYEFGSSNTSGGTNNIFVDPQFVGASTGNFKLRPTSPCIGASLGTSAPSGAIYVFNGNSGGAGTGTYGYPYDLTEMAAAETAAASGGVIIFKDGTYTLATHLDLSGAATNLAITYRPETVGGVTITGPYGLRIGNAGLTKAVSFNDFIISIGDITESKDYGLRVMNGAGGSISLKGVKGTIRIKRAATLYYANAIGDNAGHNSNFLSSFDCYLNECSFSVITDDTLGLWHEISFIGAASNTPTPQAVCNFTINHCSFSSTNANSIVSFSMYNSNGPAAPTGTILVNESIIYHNGLPGQIKHHSAYSEVTLSKCCYYKGWTNPGTSFPNKAMIIDSITVDPEFADASSSNLSLRPTSPCIGAA